MMSNRCTTVRLHKVTAEQYSAVASELSAFAASEGRPEKRALLQALAEYYTAIAKESHCPTKDTQQAADPSVEAAIGETAVVAV